MKNHIMMRVVTAIVAFIFYCVLPQPAHGFYNASTGRWISRDPIEEIASSVMPVGRDLFSSLRPDNPVLTVAIGAVQKPQANLYCAFNNAALSFYDLYGLLPCTSTEINTCIYKCKIDYPGSNAKQNCTAWNLPLIVCKLRIVACDCRCTCSLIGGITPDPGDPLHYNQAHYLCPGFGQLGGRVPKGILIPPTINLPCADIKKKFS
jgi:hypothetical protein